MEEDGAAEAFAAAEAASRVLDPLNLGGQCLARGIRDRPLTVVQQSPQTVAQRMRQADDRTQLRATCPAEPGAKEVACPLHLAIAEEVHQRLLDRPGSGRLEVAVAQRL